MGHLGRLRPPLPARCSRCRCSSIVAASFATNWSGAFPSGPTTGHYAAATRGDSLQALTTSLVTAVGRQPARAHRRHLGRARRRHAAAARASGSWTRCSCCRSPCRPSSSASPCSSRSASRRCCSTAPRSIVILAHTILVTAFAYQSVSAAIVRLDPTYEQAAASPRRPPLVRPVAGQAAAPAAVPHGGRRALLRPVHGRVERHDDALPARTGRRSRSRSSRPPTAARSSPAPPSPWS